VLLGQHCSNRCKIFFSFIIGSDCRRFAHLWRPLHIEADTSVQEQAYDSEQPHTAHHTVCVMSRAG